MSGIKVAVIGFGNMGTAHATCLAEGKIRGLELAAVCDIRPERLAESQISITRGASPGAKGRSMAGLLILSLRCSPG